MVPVDAPRPVAMFDAGRLQDMSTRATRAWRTQRWQERLGLLDVDPAESELPAECVPPGEGDGLPCALSALGQRLVGLVDWPPEADAARL